MNSLYSTTRPLTSPVILEGFQQDPNGGTSEFVTGIIAALDYNGSGRIVEDEFLVWWLTGQLPTQQEEVFDDPQPGKVVG
jgi:hypothetical protein